MGKKLDKIIGTAWSIKHEGHLNPNNIIFRDKKYKKLDWVDEPDNTSTKI